MRFVALSKFIFDAYYIISPKAVDQLNDYIDYIQYTLLNNEAAESVWQDAKDTVNQLKVVAGSLPVCSNQVLKEHGYHSVRFAHHRYLMLYRIVDSKVYVDAVYHELQDYENIFTKKLDSIE